MYLTMSYISPWLSFQRFLYLMELEFHLSHMLMTSSKTHGELSKAMTPYSRDKKEIIKYSRDKKEKNTKFKNLLFKHPFHFQAL